MTAVHLVVPEGIDDPARPSGGNAYDRQVRRGLASLGWSVHEHAVAGAASPGWPPARQRATTLASRHVSSHTIDRSPCPLTRH